MSPPKSRRKLPLDEHPPDYTIREVPIMARRKRPTGFVAHHFTCGWSTNIMVDDDNGSGYERAKAALHSHQVTCGRALPVPDRTRTTTPAHPNRRSISDL